MLTPVSAVAQTWVGADADYGTASNWNPQTVPNGYSATATFTSSGSSAVAVNGFKSVGAMVFDAGASAYTVTLGGGTALFIGGAGITNNSGQTQTFVATVVGTNFSFFNNATAGDAHFQMSGDSAVHLNDNSTAGTAVINANGSRVDAANNASFANAKVTLSNGGSFSLYDQARGGQAQLDLGTNGWFYVNTTTGTDIGSITGGGTVAFSTSAALQVGSNNQSTAFSGTITGGGSIEKVGTGTWTLTGTSNYTGGTTLTDGTISISRNASLGAASGGLIFNGGTLQSTSTFSMTRATTLNVDGTFDVAAGTLIHNGTIDGAGGLIKTGAGTLILGGTNSYAGNTTINGGTLSISNNANLGFPGSNLIFNGGALQSTADITMGRATILNAGGGTFDVAAGTTLIQAADISGAGGLTKTGAGTLVLTTISTYLGGTTINDGTVSISRNSHLGGPSGPLTFNGGTLQSTANIAMARATTLNAGGGTFEVATGTTLTQNGIIGGTGGLTKTGAGTLILNNMSNSYDGGTTLAAGTLSIQRNEVLGTGGLTFNGGTLQTTAGMTMARATTLNAGGGTFEVQVGTLTHNGVIDGAGGLTKTGVGTLVLTGTNSYLGGTTINGGTVSVSSNANLGSASGRLAFDGGTLQTTADITMSRVTTLNAGGGTFDVAAGTTLTQNGAIDGAGGLTKTGVGTLTLAGANTYTGDTTIAAGTLSISSDANLGNAGTALAFFGGTLQSTADITMSRDTILNANGTFEVATGTTLTQNGVFSGSGGVIKTGAGTLTLGGFSTYMGGTTIAAGILSISSDANLGNASTALTFNGSGALRTTADIAMSRDVILNANGTFEVAAGTTLTQNGVFTGTGGLIKTGAGMLTLGGASFYTGGTTITAGTLSISSDANLGNAGTALTFGGGGILQTTADITMSRAVTLNAGGGAFEVVTGTTLTQNGDIDGTGGLTKTGAGILVLAGANSYLGGTTITAGTLSVSTDGNLGDASGGLTFGGGTLRTTADITMSRATTLNAGGGTFDVATGTVLTQNGVIDGAGALTKIGAGTLTLTGTNTYAGGTVITAGALSVSKDVNLGDASGGLTFNGGTLQTTANMAMSRATLLNAGGGTFEVATGTTLTQNGVVDGTGALTKAGVGTLILTGTNTYSGGTKITGGTLQIGNGGASGAITGDVANAGTLAFNRANNWTFDGVISGSGSLKQIGSGRTILTGTSTYTGATIVDAGILSVNGSIASSSGVTVNSGGILAGTGIVSSTVINSGGTLAAGNSIGTLTVQGDLTFMAGSTYRVEVSPSSSDRVNVSGIATLNGATLAAIYEPGTYIAKRYTVLNAAGGVNGSFAGPVNTNLPANFTAKAAYDSNNAYLDLALSYVPPTPPAFGGGLTGNQMAVANALTNSFNMAGGIPFVFGALTSSGLTQASGESATGVQQATIDVMDRFLTLMSDPYANGRTTAMVPMSYAPLPKGTQPIMTTMPSRWSVWAAGYGGTQTTRGNAVVGSNTYTGGIYGFAAGADVRVAPDTILGFALGGAGTSYHLANGLGSGSSNVFQLGVYGRQSFGAAYVAGSLAYGWQDVTTDRRVQFDQLRARFNANSFSGRLEGGYRFGLSFGGLTPYAAGQFTHVALPAYREQAITGPGLFALSYGSKSVTAWRTELGVRADTSFDVGSALLTLRSRLAWAHNFNPDRSLSAAFLSLPASGFVVNGASPSRNAALVSAGAEMKWASGWSIAATFDGEFSGRRNSYAGKGSLRYQW